MAYENIQISQPNFCRGPLAGTFCTLSTGTGTSVLQIVNATGGAVASYVLGSNIVNTLLALEYVGPVSLINMVDGLTFFTLERMNSSTCIIKRWETRISTLQLNLKQTIIKSDTGSYYYDAKGMAVEHYRTTLAQDCEGGITYIDVASASNIANGDTLFLGPSEDADNLGAVETKIVNLVASNRVYFTSSILNQYKVGDPISFYKKFHLLSDVGVGGDSASATFFRLFLTGGVEATSSSAMYKGINTVRWHTGYRAVASVHHKNLLFIRPYYNYANAKSMFLNNFASNKVTEYTVEDIVFNGNTVYKLMNRCSKRTDDGSLIDINWGAYYNMLPDSLLPYTNSMSVYSDDDYMIGRWDLTDIMVKVRDQFNVGLRDLTLQLYKSGDAQAEFDPLDGQIDTDINGYASADYQSGTTYQGHTEISARVAGGSASNGSEYVWSAFNILSRVGDQDTPMSVFQIGATNNNGTIRQLNPIVEGESHITARSKFTSPGGDWVPTSPPSSLTDRAVLPFAVEHSLQPDGSWVPDVDMEGLYPMPNRITMLDAFKSVNNIKAVKEFFVPDNTNTDEEAPFTSLFQKDEKGEMSFSQLHMSKHSYWVAGTYYDYLWTFANLNQFVFVEDAVPKFWSGKNPKATNIWIRLRPFAYSLDAPTLKMSVREVSYEGDTGYVDVTDQITTLPIDAGGGLLGLEVLYDPIIDYHHDAIVYVSIQVHDTAYDPNFIWTNYWFTIIPDYRFPYLDNISPAREATNVPVDTKIEFDVKDDGVGVDISTFEMFVNSRIATPTITEITSKHYHVEYTPPESLLYGKRYNVKVHVADSSDNVNWLNDRFNFFTVESSGVEFLPIYPAACKRGMPTMVDVSYLALAGGDGVDEGTLRLQVAGYDLTSKSKILPVVYRIS
ncbi:MAG: hypothetical protein DRP42_01495 [Tenericutes bacterium]|nr:MAG: hypothetical protein DRP42_01495 [Mycoplasmatota bacterium]